MRSENPGNSDAFGTFDHGREADGLRRLMDDATGHLAGVRVDTVRLRHRQRIRRWKGVGAASGALAAVTAGALFLPPLAGPDHGLPPTASTTGSWSTAPAGPAATPSSDGSDDLAGSLATDISVYDADDGAEGTGTESSVIAPHGTGWSTYAYCGSRLATRQGVTKPGTGLVFKLTRPTPILEVDATIKTPGATMELWAARAGTSEPATVIPGSPPNGFEKVATASANGTWVPLRPDHPVTTTSFLIWFTALPPVAAADDTSGIACTMGDKRHHADAILHVGYRIK